MRKFSIVMPLLDTPRERKFAEKAIPSAIKLDPTELIIGVDTPSLPDDSLVQFINEICDRQSFKRQRIIHVDRSPEWGFQLANVVWHCYKACRYDTILAADVDVTLRPTVLKGLDIVGKDNVAVVSFTTKLLVRTPGDMVRSMYYRFCTKTPYGGSSGVYWIYRPYYMKDVLHDEFQKIRNGIDIYMYEQIQKHQRHRTILLFNDLGSDSMDYQNGDLPWRQFQDGVWQYANPDACRRERLQCQQEMSTGRFIVSRMLDVHPDLRILIKSIVTWHPWMYRGWLFAKKNPEHAAVLAARNTTVPDYNMAGSKAIQNIRDWKSIGRTGTGFG